MVDALVLGGGLAGSAAAIRLAESGRSVTLIERESGPHHKICGEFLSVEAHDDLAALGIDPVALGASAIDTVELVSGRQIIEAPLTFTALGLSRFRLDEALLERAAQSGADVQRGVRVTAVEGKSVRSNSGDRAAQVILLATGKHRIRGGQPDQQERPDPFVGFKMHYRLAPHACRSLAGRIRLILFDGGYAGLQMIEGGQANLCLVIRKDRLREIGGSWDAVSSMLGTLAHCGETLRDAEPLLLRPATIANLAYGVASAPASKDGIFPLGDQAGMTASLTGDGMAAALRSAFLAARCIVQGATVQDYAAMHRLEIRGQIRRAMALQHLQENRLARFMGMNLLGACPGILSHLARATRLPTRY